MQKIAPYAKAIIAALIAALGALGTALTPDASGLVSVNPGEWVAVVSALLVGLGVVFAVPNRDPAATHQRESVQPPETGAVDAVTGLVVVVLVLILLVLLGFIPTR